MRYCESCDQLLVVGYCPICDVPMVTNKEMDDPEFIRDVRQYLAKHEVSSWSLRNHLQDSYMDAMREVYHPLTRKRFDLDMSDFDGAGYREWFRDLKRPIPPEHKPYIQARTRDRFRVMATVLRAIDPIGTAHWGLRPANDDAASGAPSEGGVSPKAGSDTP